MLKTLYLTIDDSPSHHMKDKINYLSKYNIPALFYCRGEFIPKHMDQLIYAISKHYIIGNHSFSHPLFSTLSLDDCYEEILKTEKLINACYERAEKKRPKKIFRFPFGDRGAGKNAQLPKTHEEAQKVEALQNFLKQEGFESIQFDHKKECSFVDAYWDWDTQDYKQQYYNSPGEYLKKLETDWESFTNNPAILLLHDFDHNHGLFEATLDFLRKKNTNFLPF